MDGYHAPRLQRQQQRWCPDPRAEEDGRRRMEEDARAGGGAEVREEDLAGHGCHGPEPAREEADPRRRPLREGEI